MQKITKKLAAFGVAALFVCSVAAVGTFSVQTSTADAAAGNYYSSITATEGTALLGQLHDLIVSTHTKYTSYDNCRDYASTTDPALNGENGVLEFYTHETMTSFSGTKGTWNREHVWPQNLSNGLWGKSGAGSDMHHIRPSESMLNNSRGNKKFGNVTNGTPEYSKTTSGANSELGGYSNSSTFMPLDNVKGDAARIVMYVYTHYNTASRVYGTKESQGSGTLPITNIISASSESAAFDLLLEWNELDPVDEIERTRNEAAARIQGNRNPFIDNESYAEAIWGDGTAVGGGTQGGTQDDGGVGATTPTATFTPITEPQEGTYYLGMNVNGTYYYAQSEIVRDYYIGTTTDISSAAQYTLTQQGDGWIIKTGSKFLEAVVSGTHVNPKLNTSQTSGKTWSWDSDNQVFIWTDGTDQMFLGNYNGHTDISGAFIKYLGQDYPAQLGTYGTGGTTDPGTQGGGTTDPGTQGGGTTDPGTQGGGTTDPGTQGGTTESAGRITITLDSFTLTDGYGFKTWSAGGVEGKAFIYGGNAQYSAPAAMQFNKKQTSYYLASTTPTGGAIKSVTVKKYDATDSADRDWKLLTSTTPYGEVAGKPTDGTDQGTKTVTADGVTWTLTGNDTYFALTLELDKTSGAAYLSEIIIEYGEAGTTDPGTQGGGTTDPGTQGGETTDPGTQGGETTDPGTQGGETNPGGEAGSGDDAPKDKGCGSVIGIAGAVGLSTIIAAAAVVLRRKR